MEETLFDAGPGAVGAGSLGGRVDRGAPLAVRMRPRSLDDLVGQDQLLRPGSPLRLLVERREPAAVLLWGPPGSGKTTIAAILSADTGRRFVEVSAVSAGVKEVRAVVDEARRELGRGGSETVLFVDEIHRFSKAQQDALLPGVENRWVTLVAATTENPSFSVIAPLLSRCLLLTLEPLGDDGIRTVVARALAAEQGLGGAFELEPAALDQLVRLAAGDARRALGYLEAAARGASAGAGTSGPGRTDRSAAPGGAVTITAELLARVADLTLVRYDRAGDQHYDVISAFIKSVRGSDVDAALHYFARMVAAGEDPRFIARRLVILASEDIGLADPTALPTAVAAAQAVQLIGMPEARLNLGQAVIALALAPKSNAVITAVEAAMTDVRDGLAGPVPAALRDSHYPGSASLGHGAGYRYAHDDPRGVVPQRYAPEGIAGRVYYQPTGHGTEAEYAARAARIRAILAEADGPD